jgi:SAM-dependent methyltransferase
MWASVTAAAAHRSKRYHAYRLVFRHLGIPPGTMRPYALPGAARLHELRWRRLLRRAPVVDFAEHAAGVGVDEIEQPIACSICDGRRVQPLLRTPHGYHVVRCVACGLLYRNPGVRPERLGDLYAGHYSRFLTGGYATDRQRRYRLVMDAYAPLFAEGGGRRLLDFGCGAGLFLELAHDRGFEGYGVDLSRDSVEKARERPSGAHAYFGAPGDVPEIAAGGFDVVTMWSVLAHLATPVEDLRLLRSLLAGGGALLILTVNANSLLLKANGSRWGGFTPNHLKFYSPSTLPLLLRRAGFAAVAMRPMANDLVEAGVAPLSARQERRLRRAVARGNRGNMLRAVAFASPDGPRRWGFDDAVAL